MVRGPRSERVTVNFSKEELQRLHTVCDTIGDDVSGFVRRATLKELAANGAGSEETKKKGPLSS